MISPLVRSRAVAFRGVRSRGFGRVRSVAGRHEDILSNWNTGRATRDGEAREREVIARRAEELVDNDPNAASVIDSMTVNIVGGGLRPQAKVDRKRLGLTEDQAEELQDAQEKAWLRWCPEAHAGGRAFFGDMQFQSLHSVLAKGEFFYLPRMLDEARYPERIFSLALQDVHPARLSTPVDMRQREDMVDGIEINDDGRAVAYWICNPPKDQYGEFLSSSHYVRIPARIGHRPGVLHGYRYTREEQFRGRSVLAPAMKFYRLLGKSVDYELIGQIMAASMPVFIASQNPMGAAMPMGQPDPPSPYDESGQPNPLYHRTYSPGTVLYGAPGERPYILESNRPGNNFQAFAHLIMRAMAAATGMPYEVLAKDFSQTNYSSARAALLEAWRVFMVYRSWAGAHFCQITWNMVQEEAYLRGLWSVPAGAPDFYDDPFAYLGVRWIGPARGYIDPVKEILAYVKGLENNIFTHADVVAEQGGDGQEVAETRARERRRDRDLGLEAIS
ncbi:phage portal protein [Pseudodesulfovibrio tunisiensis]|uniref:phage portal protein n=1 Tax=Pseudodesulfovibrio tunisiensis TaxID=463192 RepID=UPI001FB3BBC1|nr:phage portal protein [Pseudodesulfovibrio tunisiensis]